MGTRISRCGAEQMCGVPLVVILLMALTTTCSGLTTKPIRLRDDHARSFFKLQLHQAVPKHEVVFPEQRHHETHEFLTHDTKVAPHRQRRTTSPGEHAALREPVHYAFSAFGDRFHLHLINNYQLMSDDFSATILGDDGRNETLFEFPLCYYHGEVISHGHSPVALSNCDGLNGAMYVDDQRFTIEPLPASMEVTEYNGTGEPHVVSHSTQDERNSSRGNSSDRCYTEPEDRLLRSSPEYVTLSSGVESTHPGIAGLGPDGEAHNRTRRNADDASGNGTAGASSRSKYALEVMLVLDQAMMRKRKFRSAAEANNYALSLANLASAHFGKGMLGIDLRFVVVRVLIVNRTEDGLRIGHHSVKALRSFCQWQESRHYTPWDSHPNHYDLAILITGKELCPHQDHAGCAELGRAYVGGACYRYRMCSVTYDYGMGTGFVMAHETGHSLNLTHDGHRYNENGCSSDRGTLMTAVVAGGKNVYTWSQCSKREVQTFAQSGQAYCLHDVPTRNLSKPHDMVGRRYSADDQCKLWLGESSALCQFSYTKNKRCSELWCRSANNYCRTTHVPAAMGTECGSGKVCYLGNCVADRFSRRPAPPPRVVVEQPRTRVVVRPEETTRRRTYAPPVRVRLTTQVVVARTVAPPPPTTRPSPPKAEWGNWQHHGKCSRTCGGGVQFYIRRCRVSGRNVRSHLCAGTWYRFTLCNTDDCPKESRGLYLQEQCTRAGRRLSRGDAAEEWFPGYMAATRCQLQCVSTSNRTYNSYVENGTPCSYRYNDRCVSGKCKAFGCDNRFQSTKFWDKCGVCGGDSSTCKQYSGLHRASDAAATNNTIIRIPKGARSIYIKEGAAVDSAFLYVRFVSGKVALDGAWMQAKKQDTLKVFLAGTEFTYKQAPRRPEVLTSSLAPVNEDMVVELVRLRHIPQAVQWRFLMNPEDSDDRYHWGVQPAACSVTCGKGVIKTMVNCVRRGTRDPVDDAFCSTSGSKPRVADVACSRFACPSRTADWVTKSWTSCSLTCKSSPKSGSQWRRVPCQLNGQNVAKSLCRTPRPRTSRKCNTQPCPVVVPVNGQWSDFSPYSSCSRSCGGGVQYRRRTCTNPEPQHGGTYCQGLSLTAQVCNTQECSGSVDFRSQQCAVYSRHNRDASGTEWVPHPRSIDQCKLICTPKGSDQPVVKKSRVADGTRCHPVLNNRCTFGICRTVGCDNVINSDVVDDRCGVCGGNGTTCREFASRYFVKHYIAGLYRVAEIPQGARYLNISKSSRSTNTSLVLADSSGNILLPSAIGSLSAAGLHRFEPVLGAHVNYSRVAGEREWIRVIRPLSASIVVLLNVSSYNRGNPHLRFEYTIDTSRQRKQPSAEFYTWSRTTSECSVTCGRGVASLVPRCYRKRDGEIVDVRYCRSLQRPATFRTTHSCDTGVDCPIVYTYQWRTGPWSACSNQCGRGVQNRTAQCLRAQDSVVVPNRYCRRRGLKTPNRRTACTGNQCLVPQASWSVSSWGACSVTCGAGRQSRRVTCRRNLPSAHCTGTPPASAQSCSRGRCPSPPSADTGTPQCQDRQSDDFCKLVVTYRLCNEDTEYFRLCCRRCTDARRRG